MAEAEEALASLRLQIGEPSCVAVGHYQHVPGVHRLGVDQHRAQLVPGHQAYLHLTGRHTEKTQSLTQTPHAEAGRTILRLVPRFRKSIAPADTPVILSRLSRRVVLRAPGIVRPLALRLE